MFVFYFVFSSTKNMARIQQGATSDGRGLPRMSCKQALGPLVEKCLGFSTLTAVQTRTFARVMGNSQNLVISAPTSSGKTGSMFMALIRLGMFTP